MTALATARRSRKNRICQEDLWAHDRHIRPGDLYVRLTIPPNDYDLGDGVWWSLILCERCASNRGHLA